jgi:hypothetical protein
MDSITKTRREAGLTTAHGGLRPQKKPCIWDRVDFMEWESWRDLGLSPPAGEERFGSRLRKDERGQRTR